ncbi:hypothetical protein, partial [Streptomyces rochei]|uniref:hypothetical protein n=1 Tax=Streptomyces rochei TaxID=1928 RepID=UPI0036CACE99
CWSQACVDGCDQHRRSVADGEFDAPGGHGPVVLEPIDPALDHALLLVIGLVGLRCTATAWVIWSAVATSLNSLRPRIPWLTTVVIDRLGGSRLGRIRQCR